MVDACDANGGVHRIALLVNNRAAEPAVHLACMKNRVRETTMHHKRHAICTHRKRERERGKTEKTECQQKDSPMDSTNYGRK